MKSVSPRRLQVNSIPEIGWRATRPLLLVRLPGMGYGTMTLQEYRKAGRFRCTIDVVALTTEEHGRQLLDHLPQERDHTTQVIAR
jgi:hypothetical protein